MSRGPRHPYTVGRCLYLVRYGTCTALLRAHHIMSARARARHLYGERVYVRRVTDRDLDEWRAARGPSLRRLGVEE